LTNRFSEDIDIAVIEANSFSGNQLKMLIKRLAKDMAADLEANKNDKRITSIHRFSKHLGKFTNHLSK
ncbi:MAG: nucleotidyl transferase AbiEii/AbiGii toxin family protein, partial [Bacteroidales bacterium]|nr:nucleotidyl transferase AbiEii/AbiGii toxin family protein [Bacteroidales bacterium]